MVVREAVGNGQQAAARRQRRWDQAAEGVLGVEEGDAEAGVEEGGGRRGRRRGLGRGSPPPIQIGRGQGRGVGARGGRSGAARVRPRGGGGVCGRGGWADGPAQGGGKLGQARGQVGWGNWLGQGVFPSLSLFFSSFFSFINFLFCF